MKNYVLVSTLSILTIFLLTGCIPRISNVQNQVQIQNQTPISNVQPPSPPLTKLISNKVIIQTEKLEYLHGENVKATLTNYSDKSIWYYQNPCQWLPWGIERLEKTDWENISISKPCLLSIEGTTHELKSKDKLEFYWSLRIVKEENLQYQEMEATPGKYLISFTYLTGPDKNKESVKIYSNIFEVKISPLSDFYNCQNDSDCVRVKGDSCGCNAGGTATAINKKYEKEWLQSIKNGICPQIISFHPSCSAKTKCVNGKCALVY